MCKLLNARQWISRSGRWDLWKGTTANLTWPQCYHQHLRICFVVIILLPEIIKTCHERQLPGISQSVALKSALQSSLQESKSLIPLTVLGRLKSMVALAVQQPYQCGQRLQEVHSPRLLYREKRTVMVVDKLRLATAIDLEDIIYPRAFSQGYNPS